MKTIITIGRQFGSGGKEIGIRVAKELGIPEKQFTRYLEEKKYLFRDKNRKLFPRAVKKSAGLFLVRDFYTERGKLGHYTLITSAGKRHFLERTDEILFE